MICEAGFPENDPTTAEAFWGTYGALERFLVPKQYGSVPEWEGIRRVPAFLRLETSGPFFVLYTSVFHRILDFNTGLDFYPGPFFICSPPQESPQQKSLPNKKAMR